MNAIRTRPVTIFSLFLVLPILCEISVCRDEHPDRFAVVAFFHGDTAQLKNYPVQDLTHICYSFLHLHGNQLSINNSNDSINIMHLTSLKKRYPDLKVLLSLGGWGGCKTCSDVFSTNSGRSEFANSTLEILRSYNADGLDLDWEYPSVEGYPGHRYSPEDRQNFTLLVQKLRQTLGSKYEITFAAGATSFCLSQSIDWMEVVPYVNRIHLMTYDFTNGFSKVTGHHTPLYSTADQHESSDNAIRFLDSVGVPNNKIVLGIAFYARIWSNVEGTNNGLYQAGTFLRYLGFKDFDAYFNNNGTFSYYWDSTAQAPFRYSSTDRIFATFDDSHSVALKTRYAFQHSLGGVMFWELTEDTSDHGLLNTIDKELMELRTPAGHEQQQ